MEWVRRVGEWRTLAGKRDQLRCGLRNDEQARLDELEHFFAGCADSDRMAFEQREHERTAVKLLVTFAAGGEGVLRDLSGEGAFVETAQPLTIGSRTVMRVIDRFTGDEWRFAAEVVRIARRGVGLKFVGIPLELRLGHRTHSQHPHQRAA
jgi:hypothetical protein